MRTTLVALSASRLRKMAAVQQQIEELQAQMASVLMGAPPERQALKAMLDGGRIKGRTRDWLQLTRG